ncbi:Plasmid stablization protein (fragment) [Xanthomonas citri pv. citri]
MKIAFGGSHQFGGTDLERNGDFQNQGQRGHVFSALDLAHVRARDAGHSPQFFLSNPLLYARSAHGFSEGQSWLGFKCGCARGTASLNGTLLH